MARRILTMDRYTEIRRRLAEKRSIREIARALGCSRRLVRQIQAGSQATPEAPRTRGDPLWMSQVNWPLVIHDLGLGHPLKFQWEEKAQHLTSYPNFWKQFYRKFPQYREATVTAREFVGGERVEVDWAGDPLEWVDFKSGEIRKAWVFVAGLGFSQLLFARATEDMKSRSWLGCHRRMYVYFGGVPHIHRHKMLRVKLTENQVEIFLQLERLAVHPRSRHKNGRRVRIDTHFPPASQAYYEATPQKLLSQSRFIHPQLHELFVEWFNADVYGHIRRCQGFLRRCTKEIEQSGHELASDRIVAAIGAMRRHNRIRVPYFQAYLDQLRRQAIPVQAQEPLVRRPGNPMLRYATHALATEPQHITSENSDP